MLDSPVKEPAAEEQQPAAEDEPAPEEQAPTGAASAQEAASAYVEAMYAGDGEAMVNVMLPAIIDAQLEHEGMNRDELIEARDEELARGAMSLDEEYPGWTYTYTLEEPELCDEERIARAEKILASSLDADIDLGSTVYRVNCWIDIIIDEEGNTAPDGLESYLYTIEYEGAWYFCYCDGAVARFATMGGRIRDTTREGVRRDAR